MEVPGVATTVTYLKQRVKASADPYSPLYNFLAWTYGAIFRKPSVRRAARMRAFKDSRFVESELSMATLVPKNILDAVLQRWRPRTVLDVGCGVGRTMEYLIGRGVECVGIEGSVAAIAISPVKRYCRVANLNRPVELHRKFDLVWSYEVAEHIHPCYADVFVGTLVRHADVVVMSAAHPGQGGTGHFNEQPKEYWIAKLAGFSFQLDGQFSEHLRSLPDAFAQNTMVFFRRI